jgi:glycosyltransferase involved in cell wall biosynthesis
MEMTGIGRYALETARSLQRVRPQWRFSLYSNRPELLERGDSTTILQTRLPTHYTTGRVAWLHSAAAFTALGEKPDLWFSPAFVLPIWWSGQSIVTIHDLMFMLLRSRYRGRINAWYATAATRWSARRTDRILCVSHATRDALVKNLDIDAHKVAVIPCGVADAFFGGAKGAIAGERAQSRPYVLFVGTWELRKGLGALHAAVKLVNSQGDRVRLILAGQPGWGTDEILAATERDQNVVHYERPTDDRLASLYRQAVALVYPSEMEGFGLPVAEAMACGCPVISSDLPSIREFAGDQPYYVQPGDSAEIARCIERLLIGKPELTRRRRGEEAVAGLRWDTVAERTARVIEQVTSGR